MSTTHRLAVEPGIELHVVIDDFTDPWRVPETVVMVHGMGQSLDAWRGWVPHLARHFRVLRFDVRGFGKSTPIAANARWSLERLHADIEALLAFAGCDSAHFIGAQSGGSIAMTFAARQPVRVKSLVAVAPMITGTPDTTRWLRQIERAGVLAWARGTMAGRLGNNATPAQVNYWAEQIQGRTPLSTLQSYLPWVPGVDIRPDLPKVKCPTLVMATTGSGLRPIEGVKAWQEKMSSARLLVIDGDAWHPAGAYPDVCARAALKFLMEKT